MRTRQITPECDYEPATAADLLDGLRTVRGSYGYGALIPPPGDGPDTPLTWAIQEVTNARQAAQDESARLRTNAILNARRALACLVQWYVDRDMASFCKDAPHTPKQQTAFLSRRGVIDELTASVLERAIRKRNQVEHGYTTPDLETAEDVVELLRRSIAAIRIKADPSNGPFIYGVFLYAISGGAEGIRAEFHGWQQPLVVFSRFEPRPWIGLVMPSSESRATVRRAFLTDVTTEELLQILSLAEQEYGQPSSASDLTACKVLGSAMGLVGGE